MPRLLFEKSGNAVWISHLDLMRFFQRAFKRAGLPLTHTNGFNPRPSVSIALPLSVGVESQCELLDFELEEKSASNEEICQRLNEVLVPGIHVISVYDNGRKLRDLALLRCIISFTYDNGIPEGTLNAIETLFSSDTLCVPKKTKNGIQEQNIIPMIREFSITQTGQRNIILDAVVCCQNPTLNPMLLGTAVEMYLPERKPDACSYCRVELYDMNLNIFR